MARLDIDRQLRLEPKRMEFAKKQIESLGFKVTEMSETELQFEFMQHPVFFFLIQDGTPEPQSKTEEG